MFEANSEGLYKEYKKRYKKLPRPEMDISFRMWEPDIGWDAEEIYHFYRHNAPLMTQLHQDTFARRKLQVFFGVHDVYLISAHSGGKLLGYLMLLYDDEHKFYHVIYPCVRKDSRGKDVSVYMVLCAMRFAREVLKQDEVRVLVYEDVVLNIKSLKESLIKTKDRKRTSMGGKYNYEREKSLYHVFEETLGLELVVKDWHVCYIIRLD